MNLTTFMKIGENLTDASTLGERATVGLQVTLIGMGVVFGVLLILLAILQLFKVIFNKAPAEKKVDAPAPVTTAPAPAVAPVTNTSSEEEKIVAIATAAIAASRGESECNFNIISIKKIVK